ncbi:helix-turn-helix domain-containing protein [Kangiella sp.]|uniref:helix-turn-helix domain-containing protein n=1 Tax=Kangiella sp. TaxID=1920245 RepID=UPI001984B10B|nr:helix-turn-helix domain-containing protein [Kangiella sp.]MBD3653548.1 helix-turn-helix domain-containing protein [Kangiella sp.]
MIVRKLRLKRGWSQEHLAELTGVSTRTIQRIERGQTPSLETKNALAAVFEVDIATFDRPTKVESTGEPEMNQTHNTNTSTDTEQTAKPVIEQVSAEEAEAMEYAKGIKEFYTHLLFFVIFSGVFIISGQWEKMIIAWGGWALGLIIHGLVAFEVVNIFSTNLEKRIIEKRLKKKL